MQKSARGRARAGAQFPSRAVPRDLAHARLFDLRARPFGALQQHTVQIQPRIDHQRIVQLQERLAGLGRGKHGFGDEALGGRVIDEKRILVVGLIRQPAAAGLLPGELLVEELHREAGRGQPLRGECSRRTTTQNGDTFHFFWPAGGRSSGEGIPPGEAGAPGAAIPPPCGFGAAGRHRRRRHAECRPGGPPPPSYRLAARADTSWTCPRRWSLWA